MRRRTLYRALAIALALAAITPLFADPGGDGARGKARRHHPMPTTGSQSR